MKKIVDITKYIIKDNGVISGLILLSSLSFQRLFHYPKEKEYTYNCRALGKKVSLIYSSDIKEGLPFVEIYGILHYKKSTKGLDFSLGKKSKVLDLGGFIGDSAIFFALQGAKVYSYEPQKKAYELALKNIKLNHLENNINIKCSPVTSLSKYISLNNEDKISDHFNVISSSGPDILKSLSFKEVIKKEKHWDLLKIDIEGHEWEIIEYILKNPSLIDSFTGIILELHGKNKALLDRFISILNDKKFTTELEYDEELGMFWAKKYF